MEVVFTCGRLNPPTLGHARLISRVYEVANEQEAVPFVFATRTHDRKRNPIEPTEKQLLISEAFNCPVDLTQSPYTAMEKLIEEGATQLTFVVGADRAKQFGPMVDHAAKLGARMTLRTVERTPDAISATAVRAAARDNDWTTFCRLTPSPNDRYQDRLFRAVRLGLGD